MLDCFRPHPMFLQRCPLLKDYRGWSSPLGKPSCWSAPGPPDTTWKYSLINGDLCSPTEPLHLHFLTYWYTEGKYRHTSSKWTSTCCLYSTTTSNWEYILICAFDSPGHYQEPRMETKTWMCVKCDTQQRESQHRRGLPALICMTGSYRS